MEPMALFASHVWLRRPRRLRTWIGSRLPNLIDFAGSGMPAVQVVATSTLVTLTLADLQGPLSLTIDSLTSTKPRAEKERKVCGKHFH